MSALLLLDLPLDLEAPVPWLHWDNEQHRLIAEGVLANSGELISLADSYATVPCYALLPGAAVSAHRVILPKGGRVGMTALPYQLEDKLCADLDNVHIAVGVLQARQPADVLIADRGVVQACLDVLRQSGLRIKALLPDYAVLPPNTVVIDSEQVAANIHAQPVSMRSENFAVWQQIIGPASSPTFSAETDVAAVQVYCIGDCDEGLLGGGEYVVTQSQNRLQAFAMGFQAWPLSLLSGPYLLRDESGEAIGRLRWPVILLVALLGFHWLGLGLQTYRDNREADALDEAMVTIYQQTFPGSRVVNARSQMRSQLNALDKAGGKGLMMPWLEKIAATSKVKPGISLAQLNYENDPAVMKLILNAASYEVIDQWLATLKAQGLDVERGAFGQQDSGITGQISIRGESQ